MSQSLVVSRVNDPIIHEDPDKRGGYLLLLPGKVPEIVLDSLASADEQARAEQRCLQELEAMRAREPKSRASGSAASSAGSPGRSLSQKSQRSQSSRPSQLSGRSGGASVDTIPNAAPPVPAPPPKKRKVTLEDRTQLLLRIAGVLVAVSVLGAAGMVFKLHRDAEARLRSIAEETAAPDVAPGAPATAQGDQPSP